MKDRPLFDNLTALHPEKRYTLETEKTELTTRLLDLIAPIGMGQRGLIVAAPKTGKTVILQKIANGVAKNNPETVVMVLLKMKPSEATPLLIQKLAKLPSNADFLSKFALNDT